MPRIVALAATLWLAIAGIAGAHTQQQGSLQVVHPWVTPAQKGETATVHPTLANTGEASIVIERAASPIAASVRMIFNGNTVDAVEIPAGATVTPEELMIELTSLKVDLPEGKAAPLVLHLHGMETMEVHMAIGQDTMNPEEVVTASRVIGHGHSD
jgi:copper(I)-binding protein